MCKPHFFSYVIKVAFTVGLFALMNKRLKIILCVLCFDNLMIQREIIVWREASVYQYLLFAIWYFSKIALHLASVFRRNKIPFSTSIAMMFETQNLTCNLEVLSFSLHVLHGTSEYTDICRRQMLLLNKSLKTNFYWWDEISRLQLSFVCICIYSWIERKDMNWQCPPYS